MRRFASNLRRAFVYTAIVFTTIVAIRALFNTSSWLITAADKTVTSTCRRAPAPARVVVDDGEGDDIGRNESERQQCRRALLDGNATTNFEWHPVALEDYVTCATDCERFRSTFGYSTSVDDVRNEEKEFPLAFRRNACFGLIYRPHNFYCLHVDANSPPTVHLAARSVASCLGRNVIVAHPSVTVAWATISVLDAEMLCIEQLLRLNGNWKYFINLVGRDMPLRTNLELVRILKAYRGANDIEGSVNGHSMPERVEYVYNALRQRTERRKGDPPHGLKLSKGSAHISARREFVEFAVNDRRAQDLLLWLRDTFAPDETFFNSLNRNPALKIPGTYLDVYNNYVHASDGVVTELINHEKRWQFDGKPCSGQWIRWICNVGLGDLRWVVASNKMFINKVRLELNPDAFRCLELLYVDRVLAERSGIGESIDLTFYETQPFVGNHV